MKLALIHDGRVQGETDEATAALKVFDIRDVSGVEGIKPGWIANEDGTYSAPPAPPAPPPETTVTFMEFLALFTADEQAAIISSDNVQIKLFCLMAAGATAVDLADPRTITGTQHLEALGLIAKGRAAKVLAGQPVTAS